MNDAPPGGAPARQAADPDASASLKLSPRAAAMLAYAGWWVTGALVLIADPSRPFVRFHAWQAFAGLGLLWLAGAALWTSSIVAVFVSSTAFRVLVMASQMVWLTGIVAWIACLIQAFRGERWSIPLLGGWVGALGARLGVLDRPAVEQPVDAPI